MSKNDKVSNSVIRRLPRYYRFLGELISEGVSKISSRELAERMNVTASQIRQDLNCFGGFGQQGYGYNVSELRSEIGEILGIDRDHPAVLIGAGNLGRALSVHLDYAKYGCRLCGIFDSSETLVGMRLGQLTVSPMSALAGFCEKYKPVIAILCIPKEAAPEVCEQLASLGIKAFWNFSHYDISLENISDVVIENVHLGDSLMALCYGISKNEKDKENSVPEENGNEEA
ncbi:MAG: redox-sensing transcriptional repressor Rex [Ruminiclostridium sp.]|nr:redox-sensing transcriptional repressor Rex [Ruminiclostridium sp.]